VETSTAAAARFAGIAAEDIGDTGLPGTDLEAGTVHSGIVAMDTAVEDTAIGSGTAAGEDTAIGDKALAPDRAR